MVRAFDKTSSFFIVILIAGFFFMGTVPKSIGLTENSIAIPYRIGVLVFSTLLIINSLTKINKVKFKEYWPFLLFWFIYSIRLLHDLYIDPVILAYGTPPFEYIQFAFGAVLIPCVSVIVINGTMRLNYNYILKWCYGTIFFTLCLALYLRSGSDVVGRDNGGLNVGIISFGQFGATLSILSVFLFAREKDSIKNRLFYLLGFAIGFLGIFVSASKSPLLALILVLVLFLVLWYGSLKSTLIFGISGLILYAFFIDIVTFLNNYFHSSFLTRILYAIEVGGDITRERYLVAAVNEFYENPIIGNAILIQESISAGNYPHNLIVETLMATGVIGGVVLIIWLIMCLRYSLMSIKKHQENSWIALLFLQYLIFSMFSKNIYSNDLFWLFCVLVVSSSLKYTKAFTNRSAI